MWGAPQLCGRGGLPIRAGLLPGALERDLQSTAAGQGRNKMSLLVRVVAPLLSRFYIVFNFQPNFSPRTCEAGEAS